MESKVEKICLEYQLKDKLQHSAPSGDRWYRSTNHHIKSITVIQSSGYSLKLLHSKKNISFILVICLNWKKVGFATS